MSNIKDIAERVCSLTTDGASAYLDTLNLTAVEVALLNAELDARIDALQRDNELTGRLITAAQSQRGRA